MRDVAAGSDGGAVAVVDDDADLRDAIAFLLGTEGRKAVPYASAEALLDAGPPASLACVLADVRMPGGMDGIALLRELRRRGHPAPVLVMTGHGDIPLAVRAMREGAADFLEKPFDNAALLDAIEGAIAVAGAVPARPRHEEEAKARVEALSPREREVLDGLMAGLANKAVAHSLGISARTVEVHRAGLMRRLGARTLSEAVRVAVAGGVAPLHAAARVHPPAGEPSPERCIRHVRGGSGGAILGRPPRPRAHDRAAAAARAAARIPECSIGQRGPDPATGSQTPRSRGVSPALGRAAPRGGGTVATTRWLGAAERDLALPAGGPMSYLPSSRTRPSRPSVRPVRCPRLLP